MPTVTRGGGVDRCSAQRLPGQSGSKGRVHGFVPRGLVRSLIVSALIPHAGAPELSEVRIQAQFLFVGNSGSGPSRGRDRVSGRCRGGKA